MNYINRSIESAVLHTAKTFKVLFLTGSRQVGKSTLLNRLFPDYRRVSFDDMALLSQAKADPKLFLEDNPPPLLIDEAQNAPELFPYIKILCDNSEEKGLFLLTGSQHFHMMKNISESLAGRVGIIELAPLSLREINRENFKSHFIPSKEFFKSRENNKMTAAEIWQMIHRGGYPELQDPLISWEQFYGSYVRTYIERDINQLERIKDQLLFTKFLTAIAARTGQMLNYQNIASEIEVSLATVKNWVSILEATGLIFTLAPFSNNALKKAIKTPKIFFRDTGLVCYLTKWINAEALKHGAMAGNIFETFVVSEILKSFSNEGLDYRFRVSYYRGRDKIRKRADGLTELKDAEIDLMIEENGLTHPIEIKVSANPKADMAQAFFVLNNLPGIQKGDGAIICLYDRLMTLSEGLRAVPVVMI